MNKTLKNIGIIAIIVLVVASSLMLVGKQMRANAIKERNDQEDYREWLADNCECLKREIIFCPEGFEMVEDKCYRESDKTYTLKLTKCSEYNCSGEIRKYDFKKDKWEIEQ